VVCCLLSLQTGKDRKTHLLEEEEEIGAAAAESPPLESLFISIHTERYLTVVVLLLLLRGRGCMGGIIIPIEHLPSLHFTQL